MANEYYITAATPPNDTAEANTANTYYISAGIIPDDIVAAAAVGNVLRRPYDNYMRNLITR